MKKHFRHMALSVMIAAGMCVPGNGIVFAAPDTTGTWVNETGGWRYYNAAGAVCTGWIETASGWYYLNPQTGMMMTGLQQIDGDTYYFTAPEEGIEGKLFCGWKQEADGTKRFFGTSHDGSFGSMKTGWQWIDGYCYYFAQADGAGKGAMVTNASTPDGFQVNELGQWVGEDGKAHFEAGKGHSSTEQKPGTGSSAVKGGGSGGGSGSGSSSNGSGSNSGNTGDNSSTETPEVKPLLKEAQTTLVDLGWTQYAVFAFNEGSIDDYSIEVDGIDITGACTRVDDNGTIVKWQTTVWHPGTVNVTRNADGTKQSVTFSKQNVQRVTEAGDASSAPENLVTNGPVSAFDYYLDNYDSDGNVRVHPGKTTFSVNGTKKDTASEIPTSYYVPDAEIDKDGNGEILVKLSLKTEEQEAWFSKLITIRAMNTDNKIVNDNLTFTTSTDNTYGKTGVIRISLPAMNMRSRGQYQLNLVSSYSKNKLTVPVELVDVTDFSMSLGDLNPNPKKGECFTFNIVGKNGESFGNEILSPIYRVDLTMPSGKVKTLTRISQWYEIGSMLHICGVENEDETTNNVITDEEGTYTVTVYAHGYKTMSKKVEIGSTSAVKKAVNFLAQAISVQKTDDYGVDALSGATSIGGGSSSGSSGDSSSGSSTVNGWLVFDHDLLANALILNEINPTTESSAVAQWYFDQKRVYVTDDTAEEFYNFTDYLNAVKDAKLEDGRFVSFEQYQNEGTPSSNGRPYQIKRVLEDGKLGSTEILSTMVGKNAPALAGTTGKLGQDLVLTAEDDTEYFKKIQGLYLDGSAIALRNDEYLSQYAFDGERTQIIIYAYERVNENVSDTPLSAGEHKLRIVAEGYKETTITLTVSKEIEVFDLSLAENPVPTEGEAADVYHVGQTIYVKAAAESGAAMRGDFLHNLVTVILTKPNGDKKTVLSEGQESYIEGQGYKLDDGKLILGKDLFETAGEYELLLQTNTDAGYAPKTLKFKVEAAVETPAEANTVPKFAGKELVAKNGSVEAYYKLKFESEELTASDIIGYLGNAKAEIYVDDIKLRRDSSLDSSYGGDAVKVYKVPDISSAEAYLAVRLSNMAGTHKVVIKVPEYNDLKFEFDGDDIGADLKEAPKFKEAKVMESENGNYYKITFEGDDKVAYLREDSLKVFVNETEYEKLTGIFPSVASETKTEIFAEDYGELQLRPDSMDQDLTVEIIVDGYATCSFEIKAISDSGNIGNDDEYTPTVIAAEKGSYWGTEYYQVQFEEDAQIAQYIKSEDFEVTVNGTEYHKAGSVFSFGNNKPNFYAGTTIGSNGSIYVIWMTTDAFTTSVNTVEINAGDSYGILTLKINQDGSLAGEATSAAEIEDPEAAVIAEKPEDTDEISDEIIDEDENVTDDSNAEDEAEDKDDTSDDINDTDSADDTVDKADESGNAADDNSGETGEDEAEDKADDITDEDDSEDDSDDITDDDIEDDAEDTDAADKDEEESSETEEDSEEARV